MKSLVRTLFLIKLGGALITEKQAQKKIRTKILKRLWREIRLAHDVVGDTADVIVGHGQGSFAHGVVAEYELKSGLTALTEPARRAKQAGLVRCLGDIAELHQRVVQAGVEVGLTAMSARPNTLMGIDSGRAGAAVKHMLSLGLVPVVCGDLVFDRHHDWRAWSTEMVFELLARDLADRYQKIVLLYVTDVPGVLDRRGQTIQKIDRAHWPSVAAGLWANKGVDVTGGMRHKVEASLDLVESLTSSVSIEIISGWRSGEVARALTNQPRRSTQICQ